MELRLALLRTPTELLELVSRPRHPFTAPTNACPARGLRVLYEHSLRPMAAHPLAQDWAALSRVCGPSQPTRARVLRVLEATRPAAGPEPCPSLARLQPEPAPPGPSAAHPRAYRGTRQRPARPPALPVLDLRPYLCAPVGVKAVLDWLGCPRLASGPELPGLFLRELLPMDAPEDLVGPLLTYYWRLELAGQAGLRRALARLTRLARERVLEWCAALETQPRPLRTVFATLLLESGAWEHSPEGWNFLEFAGLVPRRHYAQRCWELFQSLSRGASWGYWCVGLGLEAGYASDSLAVDGDCANFPIGPFQRLAAHVEVSSRWYKGWSRWLWRACGRLSGLGQTLAQLDWCALTPQASQRALDFLCPWEALEWSYLRSQAPRIHQMLRACRPDYQLKLAEYLLVCQDFWSRPGELARHLPVAYPFLERLCQPPFGAEPSYSLCQLLHRLDPPGRARLLQAPDRSFLALEKATRRNNPDFLVSTGLAALIPALPELVLEAFESAPRRLMPAAALIRTVASPGRESLLREVAAHPLMARVERSEAEWRSLIEEALPHTAPHRVGQLNRSVLARLDLLEQRAEQALRQDLPLPGDSPTGLHALRLLNSIKENRKPLRRLLKAWARGETDYRVRHPQTRAWLAAHPELNVRVWAEGLVVEQEVPGLGPVRLAPERDPLEILKMGTVAGTCLGLGGGQTYSAAAVALDYNKLVVYARDPRGRILARQLLALSAQLELVCYCVYGEEGLEWLFADYDRRLAQALGRPIRVVGDYQVELLLAEHWWDDYAWDDMPTGGA